MRSAIAMIAMLWVGVGLSSAHAETGEDPMRNWDTAAPVVVAELAQIISAGGNNIDTWQKRGEWLLGAMGKKRETSLSALAEAEMYYLAEYHELTPSELARTLKVALPSGVEQWAMPMRTLRSSEAFIQPLRECMAGGDPFQSAVCHMLLIDVVTSQYQPSHEIKKQGYIELLEGSHYLQTIIDVATTMTDDVGFDGSAGFNKESSDLPLNVALAKSSLVAAGRGLVKSLH